MVKYANVYQFADGSQWIGELQTLDMCLVCQRIMQHSPCVYRLKVTCKT